MADKRQEFELRARQCLEQLKGVMTEAHREGLSVSAAAVTDINGEPKITVAVLLR